MIRRSRHERVKQVEWDAVRWEKWSKWLPWWRSVQKKGERRKKTFETKMIVIDDPWTFIISLILFFALHLRRLDKFLQLQVLNISHKPRNKIQNKNEWMMMMIFCVAVCSMIKSGHPGILVWSSSAWRGQPDWEIREWWRMKMRMKNLKLLFQLFSSSSLDVGG